MVKQCIEKNKTYEVCISALKDDVLNLSYVPFPIDRTMLDIILSSINDRIPSELYDLDILTYDDILKLSKCKKFNIDNIKDEFKTHQVIKIQLFILHVILPKN